MNPEPARRPALFRILARYGIAVGFGGYLAFLVADSVELCQGQLIYSLDDAYIHMGLAKRLVREGVWGAGDGFASVSSSILWPLALALVYMVKGTDVYTPLVLQFVGLAALMVFLHRVMRRDFPALDRRGWPAGLLFLAIAGAAPAAALVLGGLEHIWHLVAVLLVADLAAVAIAAEVEGEGRPAAERRLVMAAPLLTLLRFETGALALAIGFLLLARGRVKIAVATVASAFAPALIFGGLTFALGFHVLPNPLILKRIRYAPGQPLGERLQAFADHMHWLMPQNLEYLLLALLSLFTLGATLFFTRRPFVRPAILLFCHLTLAMAHLFFGSFGWLFRYEAYVLALGVFANAYAALWLVRHGLSFGRLPGWRQGLALAAWLVFVPALAYLLAARAIEAAETARLAARNIYEQQVQVARFLQAEYPGAGVALNDIGAVSYFAEVRLFDLFGLGSNEVVEAKRAGLYHRDWIEQAGSRRRLELAVVYDIWFGDLGGLPPSWIKVGEWEISDNEICGSAVVSFYAMSPAGAERLERSLEDFSARLPERVGRRLVERPQPAGTAPAPATL
jgi:hypothetical protein